MSMHYAVLAGYRQVDGETYTAIVTTLLCVALLPQAPRMQQNAGNAIAIANTATIATIVGKKNGCQGISSATVQAASRRRSSRVS
ncbi:unnamed protein product [Peniophora sp. CBMAI 1063]|nr:unnamed protein product [Peniophora sp. CBMAI 1063]